MPSNEQSTFKRLVAGLAAFGYGLAILSQSDWSQTPDRPPAQPEKPIVDITKLEDELRDLTQQVRLQNQFAHRFAMSVVIGVGTALGATVVAALIIVLLRPIFNAIGLEDVLPERPERVRTIE